MKNKYINFIERLVIIFIIVSILAIFIPSLSAPQLMDAPSHEGFPLVYRVIGGQPPFGVNHFYQTNLIYDILIWLGASMILTFLSYLIIKKKN